MIRYLNLHLHETDTIRDAVADTIASKGEDALICAVQQQASNDGEKDVIIEYIKAASELRTILASLTDVEEAREATQEVYTPPETIRLPPSPRAIPEEQLIQTLRTALLSETLEETGNDVQQEDAVVVKAVRLQVPSAARRAKAATTSNRDGQELSFHLTNC
jgi:hypothetical protein